MPPMKFKRKHKLPSHRCIICASVRLIHGKKPKEKLLEKAIKNDFV